MQVPTIVLGAVLVLTGAEPDRDGKAPANTAVLQHCLVSLIEEAQVPAQEAGVLVGIDVREGHQVAAGQLLAQIDDSRAVMAHRVAGLELQVAQEKASNDISVRYAKAASQVAEAEYLQGKEANDKVAGTVPQAEMRRLMLTHRRSVLQIEQAQLDLHLATLQVQVDEAEMEAAAKEVERRRIKSPLDGIVVKVYQHSGEWVKPGDPVLHVVRVDRLRIEGFLNASEYAPAEVDGRPITVRIELARGRQDTFQGKVVFVSPLVEAGGEFRIWAEVLNRKQNEHWLLRPGLSTEMMIHLK